MKAKYPLRYITSHFKAIFSLFLYSTLFIFAGGLTSPLFAQAPPIIEQLSTCTQPLTPVIICMEGEDPDGDNVFLDEEETHTLFNCSLTFLNDSCFQYIPLPGMSGTDTVYVVQCDDATPSLCSTSEVYVTIGCEAPLPENDNVQINATSITVNGVVTETTTALQGVIIGVTENDSDPCNKSLLVTNISSQPNNGTSDVVLGQVSYVPNEGFSGQDVLEYVVCNDCPKCDTATVVIDVTANINCNKDFSICISAADIPEICPEFCEIPLDQIEGIITTVTDGTLNSITENCFNYIPPSIPTSNAVAMFIACTEAGFCDTTYVDITVNPDCGTSPPVAMDDEGMTTTGGTVTINVLGNDSDPDGQTLTVTNIITPPDCGIATINNNNITYSAGDNCNTIQSIVYEVCDPTGLCTTATVLVTVEEVTGCSFEDEYCLEPLQKVEICVQFCDLDGGAVEEVKPLFDCSIEILNDTCFTYIPLPGYFGTDSLRVIGCNEEGVCDTLLVLAHSGCIG
ncbi:MAG: Ig-like domain-containing protein, partial [Chitinophagales bacterium]